MNEKNQTTVARVLLWASAAAVLSSVFFLRAQDQQHEFAVQHADCVFLGPRQREFKKTGLEAQALREYIYSQQTALVTSQLGVKAATQERLQTNSTNVIDQHLFRAWREAGVTPANKTTDYEFLRRVSFDLTGRPPSLERIQRFIADSDPQKRERLVDELLASEGWVDKWTMFFGDLYKNTVRTSQVVRYNEGRNAFYRYLNRSLAENKPYNRLVSELISASGENSYEQGNLGWLISGVVVGGPVQDIWDQMAVNAAEMFLGIAHYNCIACHDGRRHLDTLSLWGKSATRVQTYQMASFFSRTEMLRVRVNPADPNPYYYSVLDNTRYRSDYPLNTTTGNRPPRQPIGAVRTIAPEYPFTGGKPRPGESYRVALARELTGDFQFARATVNYIWKEFMGKAFVEPPNQFDPARLDPDHPPPAPWKLQPNQPRLLNALAQAFIDGNYDLKKLMRTIVLSESYQLQSQYPGEWNPAWEDLYARHLVRRLWAEEIHDAIVLSSHIPVNYAVPGLPNVGLAMKLPDVVNVPGGDIRSFLDSFMRGNRDNEERQGDGSTLQALNLMNDSFVMSRTRATGTAETGSLLRRALNHGANEQLITMLFLSVLNRPPTNEEMLTALANLNSGNRTQRAEDLLWALYNKVDFLYNY
ncbi:MAG: DUF1549 and DUF1553 domain-containing protein [Bryobacteraceae bacterium]|nr:DUF1549 and DUF1553 domain-containing protein [Bryobacteraceae bacterium]MDW8378962.1 DUF1549 domain-containing protein [Bryobacterales bacterium]